ncbi:hypothetical protein [Prosthecobacter debontii]|uniref:hypothetical protein n=1 Tax=Prosthecobacter debontii TaxID=48467 RepID=UPI0011178EDA|nr:hypothetical protein [Prosthecobacter debontii]
MNPVHLILSVFGCAMFLVSEVHVHAANLPARPAAELRTTGPADHLSVPLALSYHQVVLEKRSGSGWRPLSVLYPRTLSREQMRDVHFVLPSGLSPEDVRVLGYRNPKFPSRFAYGKQAFSRYEVTAETAAHPPLDRLRSQKAAPVPSSAVSPPSLKANSLWHLAGETLLVYHHHRGLQVVDLKDPDNPLKLGTLRLPVVGEKLWALNEAGTEVMLLGRSIAKERQGSILLYLLKITNGLPEIVKELTIPGRLTDSRFIGPHLHVLSQSKKAGQGLRTLLTRLDLSQPPNPTRLSDMVFSGGGAVFQTQDTHLMVRVKEGSQVRLHEVPVSSAAGQSVDQPQFRSATQVLGYDVRIRGQDLILKHATEAQVAQVTLPLGWRTDRVIPSSDILLQVEDGLAPGSQARVRVTPITAPDMLLQELPLGPGRVVGMTQQDDEVFIAQWVPASLEGEAETRLLTWTLNLSDPSAIKLHPPIEQRLKGLDEWDVDLSAVQPLRLHRETLLWFIPARHHPSLWWSSPIAVAAAQPSAQDLIPASSAVMVLCPVHLTKTGLSPEEPQILRIRGRVLHTSRAISQEGFIFFSHDSAGAASGSDLGPPSRVPWRPQPGEISSWLHVVDCRSGAPLLRDPVSIPGQLLSVTDIDDQGAVVLTETELSLRRDSPPARVIQASGYDGVSVRQFDNYITGTTASSAAAAQDDRLYLTRETGRAAVVVVRYAKSSGKLSQAATWNTNAPPTLLHAARGHLVASSPGNLELAFADAEAGKLTSIASYDTPASLWLQVDRTAFTEGLDLWIPAGDYGVEFLQKQGASDQ